MALFYNKDGKLIPITSNAVNFNVTEIKEELTDIKSKIPKTTNSTDNQLVNQTYVKDALLNVHTHDNKKVLDKVSEDTTKDRLKFNGRVYLAEEDVPETAIKAIGDSEGNKIVDTYVTKVSFDKNNTELQNSIASEAEARAAKDTELQNSIDTLNGTGAGSISKTVSDAIISIINGAPEKFDTLKEISDWITTHETSAASMNTQIQSNKSNIDALSKKVDNMGSSVNTKLNISGDNGTAVGVSNLINKLNVGTTTPVDEDYYVAQYANGGTTTTSFYRRPLKALWEYIKNKLSSTFGLGGTKTDNAIVRFNGTGGAIQNTGVTIDDNNNINMVSTGTTGTSNKISFNGSNDGADIYYQVTASDQGNLVLNTRDDTNCYIQFANNGTFHSYISTNDGIYHGTATSAQSATNAQNATNAQSVNGTVIASSLRIPTTAPSNPQNGNVWLA